jgi:uncharacterized protein YejL (UPF0352 family)
MALSSSLSEISLAIMQVLEAHKAQLGLRLIILGGNDLVPEFPAVIITASGLTREIRATHKFAIEMQHDLFIMLCKIGSPEDKEENAIKLLQDIVDVLAEDRLLAERVIFSYAAQQSVEEIVGRSVTYRGGTIKFVTMSEEMF